jgi:hypothetical protein
VIDVNDYDCVLECQHSRGAEVGANSISCDHCKHWYHFECLRMSKRDHALYAVEDKPYYCPNEECQEFAEHVGSPPKKRAAPQNRKSKRAKSCK